MCVWPNRRCAGAANIAEEYATKRYRTSLINWGIIPLVMKGGVEFIPGDYILLPGIRDLVETSARLVTAFHIGKDVRKIELSIGELTCDERKILLAGSLINYYNKY